MERGTKDVRKSISSSWNIASEHSTNTVESVSYIYAKRKEFAPHIIGGSAFLGGSVMTLRRGEYKGEKLILPLFDGYSSNSFCRLLLGRIAGILGASFFGASAYGLVHDELSFENVPNMIFGNKK
jgi:hypothetical protein